MKFFGCVALVACFALAVSCSDPTSSGRPAVPKDTIVASIDVDWPPSLLVNQTVLLKVIARNAAGDTVRAPTLVWASTDGSIASVANGVATGVRRGTATIEATAGQFRLTRTLRVFARVRVRPALGYSIGQIAVGDTIQFVAAFEDVNGSPIAEIPAAQWASSDSSIITVSPSGLVAGVRFALSPPPCPCDSAVSLTASTEDGVAAITLRMSNVVAGLPATLRLVHANPDADAFTFRHTRGAPVTLRFGESAEVPITSGTLALETEGFPFGTDYSGTVVTMIRPGDALSLYAVGDDTSSRLVKAYSEPAILHPDSGRVRFVQGYNSSSVVYLRPVGGQRGGIPELCYFDPGNLSDYYTRAAGDFDVIVQQKYSTVDFDRLRANAVPGESQTIVFVRGDPAVRMLVFRDR